MDAYRLGDLFGFLFAQLVIFAVLTVVIAGIARLIKGRGKPFTARLLDWKVLVPAFLVVLFLNLLRLANAAGGEPYSARQLAEIKEGCLETAVKSGQTAAKVEAYCDCTVAEIRGTYPTALDAQVALDAGVSPELKPKLMACARKSFGPVPG